MKNLFLILGLGIAASACSSSEMSASEVAVGDEEQADSLSSSGTFYVFSREGQMRCQGSACSGDYLKHVNSSTTKCSDGRYAKDCYVHKLDYSKLALNTADEVKVGVTFEMGSAIVRGTLGSGKLDDGTTGTVLKVSEAWLGTTGKAQGTFYRVYDSALVCVTAPCPTLHEAKLNSTVDDDIGDVVFPSASATAIASAKAAFKTKDGVLFVGTNATKGGLISLKATEFYTRVVPSPVCPAASSTIRYMSTEATACASIVFSCTKNEKMFSNSCGCGCALLE